MTKPLTAEAAAAEKQGIGAQAPTWHYSLFANPQAFINFVNLPPAQVAGQIAVSVRDNGQVDGFYFL